LVPHPTAVGAEPHLVPSISMVTHEMENVADQTIIKWYRSQYRTWILMLFDHSLIGYDECWSVSTLLYANFYKRGSAMDIERSEQ